MEINETVLAEFVCSACTELMHPPIKVCSLRHNFCDKCAVKAQWCPICNKNKRIAHHIKLESLYERTIFPCKYRADGCAFKAMGAKVKEHEEFCQLSRRLCPLTAIDNCKWSGKLKEVIEHCKESHPGNTYCTWKQTLKCSNFSENDRGICNYHVIFQAYGEVFRLMWEVDYSTGMMKWRVAYIGHKEEAVRYYFELDFRDPGSSAKAIHLRAVCQPFEERELFYSSVDLHTRFESLRNFCKDGVLYYTISLYSTRRDLPTPLEKRAHCGSKSRATTKGYRNEPKPFR